MSEIGIKSVSRRSKKQVLKSSSKMPAVPYLFKRNFAAEHPNELWVADITYILTWEGWLFLAAVMDVFIKKDRWLVDER